MKKKNIIKTLGIILALTFALTACDDVETVSDTAQEVSDYAEYEKWSLQLKDSFIDEENNSLHINATYTNNSEEPTYAASCFAVRAFQNDKELTESVYLNGEDNLATEVRNGQSVDVIYSFELTDRSEAEVLVGEPTAEQATIGKKVYNLEN
ncbi:protein of unknown function [Acetitomaculum ruminis DSM 5522]|uniref:DUF5067 domain-containing protein n=1 Tax=Acetitomaculum ruminis DSM 5522 TaxID=1120918 RepID=A0A1I0YSI3_9FIRM|nr:DUF5067 domain-containing protein [Acetitomaculum ruminis]SFB15410.1 protein of unknown function [Acetitomaculum ruminis DSM 5522]